MDKSPHTLPRVSDYRSPHAFPLKSPRLGSSRCPHISGAVSALAASVWSMSIRRWNPSLHHFSLLHTNIHFTFTNHFMDLSNTKYLGVAGMGHVRRCTIFCLTANLLSIPFPSLYFYSLLLLKQKGKSVIPAPAQYITLGVSLLLQRSLSNIFPTNTKLHWKLGNTLSTSSKLLLL